MQRPERHARLGRHRPQGGARHAVTDQHGARRRHQLATSLVRLDVGHRVAPFDMADRVLHDRDLVSWCDTANVHPSRSTDRLLARRVSPRPASPSEGTPACPCPPAGPCEPRSSWQSQPSRPAWCPHRAQPRPPRRRPPAHAEARRPADGQDGHVGHRRRRQGLDGVRRTTVRHAAAATGRVHPAGGHPAGPRPRLRRAERGVGPPRGEPARPRPVRRHRADRGGVRRRLTRVAAGAGGLRQGRAGRAGVEELLAGGRRAHRHPAPARHRGVPRRQDDRPGVLGRPHPR